MFMWRGSIGSGICPAFIMGVRCVSRALIETGAEWGVCGWAVNVEMGISLPLRDIIARYGVALHGLSLARNTERVIIGLLILV